MSLLEDIFLQDEAGEAQELERVIEDNEYEDRPTYDSDNSNNNSEKEDEAEEDKRRVDPTAKAKKVVKNPRFILNPARLTGPRGIHVLPDHFKDFKFRGKGHEKEDLDLVLKKLEHWAYRLYPKFKFDDCLKKIETLGKKRPVMVHLQKIRSDQLTSEEIVVQRDSSDDEAPQEEDEFDKLLQQQIDLARSTPAPNSAKKAGFGMPRVDSRPMPKATSSPSISDEQKERMIRNRRLAEERRLAKLKNNTNIDLTVINEIPRRISDNFNDNDNIDLTNSNNTDTQIITDNVENNKSIDLTGNFKNTNVNKVTVNLDANVSIDLTNNTNIIGAQKIVNDFDNNKSIDLTTFNNTDANKVTVDLDANVSIDLTDSNKTDRQKNTDDFNHNKSIDLTGFSAEKVNTNIPKAKKNNTIDSSDSEDELVVIQSAIVDVHNNVNNTPKKYNRAINVSEKQIDTAENSDLVPEINVKNNDRVDYNDIDIQMNENSALSDDDNDSTMKNDKQSPDVSISNHNKQTINNDSEQITDVTIIDPETVCNNDKQIINDDESEQIDVQMKENDENIISNNDKQLIDTVDKNVNKKYSEAENDKENLDNVQNSNTDLSLQKSVEVTENRTDSQSNKENVDVDLMDVDFSDDF